QLARQTRRIAHSGRVCCRGSRDRRTAGVRYHSHRTARFCILLIGVLVSTLIVAMPTRQAAGEPAPSPARASGESAAPINPPTGAPEVAGPRAGEPARTPEPAADARPSRPARLPEGQDPKADPKDPDGLRAKADEKQQVPAALEMPQPCDPFPDEPTGGTPKIMITGDSISQGSSGDYTWRYRLYKHLTANGVTPDFVGPYN